MSKNETEETSSFNIPREVCGIIAISLAIFILACTHFSDATGVFGRWIVIAFSNLFGKTGLNFIPLFFALSAIAFITKPISTRRVTLASVSLLLVFLLFLEAIAHPKPLLIWPIKTSDHGGFIGLFLHRIIHVLIGKIGTWVIIIGGSIISSLLLFNLSFADLLKSLFNKIKEPFQSHPPLIRNNRESMQNQGWKNTLIRTLFYTRVSDEEDDFPIQRVTPRKTPPEPTPQASTPIEKNYAEPKYFQPQEDLKTFELADSMFNIKPEIEEDASQDSFEDDSDEDADLDTPQHSTRKSEKSVKRAPVTIENPEDFALPIPSLLKAGAKSSLANSKALTKHQQEQSILLEEMLASFHVEAKVVHVTTGPSVTRFELKPGDGVKISKITALSKDIALKLAAPDIRIEAPIPGKALVGIEVPNTTVEMVTMRSIMESSDFFASSSKLLAVIGLTITGESIVMDLGKMPHVLIAGATGAGKSVCINAIILSILMKARPDEVKFLMIDPKKVELSLYQDIPHLLAPVVTNPHKAAATLKKWALIEMENRYELFSAVGVKDIAGYNNYVEEQTKKLKGEGDIQPKLPYIVVVIDELADLMMVAAQDVEHTICRLAQMARATGIHLVVATQRPSVNVVTGLIKANIPSRISFFLQSQIDSRTILDMPGAEKLLGKGDMLYSPVGSFKPKRVQGVFVSEAEVKAVVEWLKKQQSPEYSHEIMDVEPLGEDDSGSGKNSDDDEPLYNEAKQLVMNTKYASTSYLQRKLRIGYNRAARIMDQLEQEGVIAQYAGEKKARSVI